MIQKMKIERRERFGLTDIKADASAGTFSGYGSTFGNVDSYGDTIQPGAFDNTLKSWKAQGRLPKMLLQHGGIGFTSEDMLPVGQWTGMEEDQKGLFVQGKLFALNTDLGQRIYENLKAGELDLSIGFNIPAGGASAAGKDSPATRIIKQVDLWEVSLVTFPADSFATTFDVKSAFGIEKLREFEDALGDRGISRKDRATVVSVLKEKFLRDAGEPISEHRDDVSPEEKEILKMLERTSDAMWSGVFGG
jgi:HK97 family phage prohead protease